MAFRVNFRDFFLFQRIKLVGGTYFRLQLPLIHINNSKKQKSAEHDMILSGIEDITRKFMYHYYQEKTICRDTSESSFEDF